jgi:hypothetical protein
MSRDGKTFETIQNPIAILLNRGFFRSMDEKEKHVN